MLRLAMITAQVTVSLGLSTVLSIPTTYAKGCCDHPNVHSYQTTTISAWEPIDIPNWPKVVHDLICG